MYKVKIKRAYEFEMLVRGDNERDAEINAMRFSNDELHNCSENETMTENSTHCVDKVKEKNSNTVIYRRVMEAKSLLDTIAETKGLDADHDLCLASDRLDSFLDALESQDKTILEDE